MKGERRGGICGPVLPAAAHLGLRSDRRFTARWDMHMDYLKLHGAARRQECRTAGNRLHRHDHRIGRAMRHRCIVSLARDADSCRGGADDSFFHLPLVCCCVTWRREAMIRRVDCRDKAHRGAVKGDVCCRVGGSGKVSRKMIAGTAGSPPSDPNRASTPQCLAMGGIGRICAASNGHIMRWNGTAWSALGSGMDDYVDMLAADRGWSRQTTIPLAIAP